MGGARAGAQGSEAEGCSERHPVGLTHISPDARAPTPRPPDDMSTGCSLTTGVSLGRGSSEAGGFHGWAARGTFHTLLLILHEPTVALKTRGHVGMCLYNMYLLAFAR